MFAFLVLLLSFSSRPVFLLVACFCFFYFYVSCFFCILFFIINVVHFSCIDFSCSLSSFSYFLLFFIMFFLIPLLYLPLPLCPFDYVLLQHDTPNKDTKAWFCFYWQNRAGLSQFHKNDILWENRSFMLPECKQNFGKSCLSRFQKHTFMNIDTYIFRGHIVNPSKKEPPNLKKSYFCSVLLFAPLHQNSTSRNHIQPRCKKRAVFQTPHSHVEEHHHQNPHNSETAEHSWNSPKTSQIPIFAVQNWRG